MNTDCLGELKKLLQKFYNEKAAPLTIVEIGGLKIIRFKIFF